MPCSPGLQSPHRHRLYRQEPPPQAPEPEPRLHKGWRRAWGRICAWTYYTHPCEWGQQAERTPAERFPLRYRLRIITSMQKLCLNVAVCLLFIAFVILAQAPEGGGPPLTGPDAAATNLVNTVCSSCHTLDRVKNKVADKDGW